LFPPNFASIKDDKKRKEGIVANTGRPVDFEWATSILLNKNPALIHQTATLDN
jgi:hypothetical protein